MAWLGWRAIFIATGVASLLWLWPWLTTPRIGGAAPSSKTHAIPSSLELLRNRELWGSCLGQFCETYALFFVLSWLPVYLVKARGFSIAEMAQIGSGVYAMYALTSVITGWGSDAHEARFADERCQEHPRRTTASTHSGRSRLSASEADVWNPRKPTGNVVVHQQRTTVA